MMHQHFEKYKTLWDERPLVLIMGIALFFRLLATIFAKGWGMFDDHFIVIESSQSWVDGYDYNDWLPGSPGNTGPTGHNLFYPGIHYLLFSLFSWTGLTDPQSKMFVIRLIHGLFSLITVYLGYRITETLYGKRSARISGLLLALLWFMPFMSVRNLVEMTCIPFLMAGYWMMIRGTSKDKPFLSYFLAGVFFGLAFNIRPQTLFFPVGIGLVMLFQQKWKELAALTLGSLLMVTLVQGGIDFIVWGYPFAEMLEYLNVCFTQRDDYISLPWYNYFLTLLGMVIPPVSFFLLFGFIRKWKRYLIIFLPVLLFFIFHSWFPNKQERFILPMLPFLIMVGSIGWVEFVSGSKFWLNNKKLLRCCWGFFWVINCVLLMVFTFTYSKRSRVETMVHLSKYPDIKYLMILDSEGAPDQIPKFYLNQWVTCYSEYAGNKSPDTLLSLVEKAPAADWPRFVLFSGEKDRQQTIDKALKCMPSLVYETTVEPGFMDRTLHQLNPFNKNQEMIIYRNRDFFPKKIE